MQTLKFLAIITGLVLIFSFVPIVQAQTFTIPNSVGFGQGIRIYLVNSVQTVPAQQPFEVGGQMEYPWAVQNTGTVSLTNIVASTTLKSGVSNFSSDICTIQGNFVSCVLPDLAPGERYPSRGFFSFFVTVEPELSDQFYWNFGKVCAGFEGITYCATDNSVAKIQAFVEPEPIPEPIPEPEPVIPPLPPILDVTVTNLTFDFTWTQEPKDNILPTHYLGEYYVSQNGVIIQDTQNLEKTCPSINIHCGPFDIQGNIGTYSHTHETNGVFNHCFTITGVWEEFGEIRGDTICKDTIAIPELPPTIEPKIEELENKIIDLENRLVIIEGQEPIDITDIENRLNILEQAWQTFQTAWNSIFA